MTSDSVDLATARTAAYFGVLFLGRQRTISNRSIFASLVNPQASALVMQRLAVVDNSVMPYLVEVIAERLLADDRSTRLITAYDAPMVAGNATNHGVKLYEPLDNNQAVTLNWLRLQFQGLFDIFYLGDEQTDGYSRLWNWVVMLDQLLQRAALSGDAFAAALEQRDPNAEATLRSLLRQMLPQDQYSAMLSREARRMPVDLARSTEGGIMLDTVSLARGAYAAWRGVELVSVWPEADVPSVLSDK